MAIIEGILTIICYAGLYGILIYGAIKNAGGSVN